MDGDFISQIQQLYNACTKYPDLESYLENYIKTNNKFDYGDSAGSYECKITTQNEDKTNKYVIDIYIYPSCGGGKYEPYNEKLSFTTLCELFENEYVSLACGYNGFKSNYITYKQHPDLFNDYLLEGQIS